MSLDLSRPFLLGTGRRFGHHQVQAFGRADLAGGTAAGTRIFMQLSNQSSFASPKRVCQLPLGGGCDYMKLGAVTLSDEGAHDSIYPTARFLGPRPISRSCCCSSTQRLRHTTILCTDGDGIMAATVTTAVPAALPAVLLESRTNVVYIVSAVLTGISIIVFSLRLYTRCVLLKTAGSDDWTMLVAQFLAVVLGVATIMGTFTTPFGRMSWGVGKIPFLTDFVCRGLLWPGSSWRHTFAEQH